MCYLENSESKISKEFSEILPPADKRNVGMTLKPEQFTDICLSKPAADYIDVFNKRQFYDQNQSRYFNLTLDEMNNKVPRELLFLAGLYSSWNTENLTSAQFAEAERKLELFPAASLAKKIDNSNLLSLKKKQLMNVLRRKYNLYEKYKG